MATAQADQSTAHAAYLTFITAMGDVKTSYDTILALELRANTAAMIAKLVPIPENMDPQSMRVLLKKCCYDAFHAKSQPLAGAAATDRFPRYDLLAGAAYASKWSPTPP